MNPTKTATPSVKYTEYHGPVTPYNWRPVWYTKSLSRLSVQAAPYNLVLPLTVKISQVVSGYTSDWANVIQVFQAWNPDTNLFKHAYNKAYNKLQESINANSAQLGANLGELKKTADTVNNRAYWIFNQTARLEVLMRRKLHRMRKHNKRKYRRYVKIARRNNVSPTVAGLFIEYRWVYEATAKDIYSAVQFMESFEPKTNVYGKGIVLENSRSSRSTVTADTRFYDISVGRQKDTVKLSANAKITNPNLYWAQQMGLTNPVAVAWELTKFSWLIDWFGTLGEVINSWDDNLGLELSSPCMVTHREMLTNWNYIDVGKGYSDVRNAQFKVTWIDRDGTIGNGPFLLFRQIKGPSLVRGATAIALLTQLLRR